MPGDVRCLVHIDVPATAKIEPALVQQEVRCQKERERGGRSEPHLTPRFCIFLLQLQSSLRRCGVSASTLQFENASSATQRQVCGWTVDLNLINDRTWVVSHWSHMPIPSADEIFLAQQHRDTHCHRGAAQGGGKAPLKKSSRFDKAAERGQRVFLFLPQLIESLG